VSAAPPAGSTERPVEAFRLGMPGLRVVPPHHVERSVAEGVLEVEHRHALVDAPSGEGVAQLVRVAVNPAVLLEAHHQTLDAVTGHAEC
jgi:hypothetical protein